MTITADDILEVLWYQHVNEYSTVMTCVKCLRTGWKCSSNQYALGKVTDANIGHMANIIRHEYYRQRVSKGVTDCLICLGNWSEGLWNQPTKAR